jgi:hypothetical protein
MNVVYMPSGAILLDGWEHVRKDFEDFLMWVNRGK